MKNISLHLILFYYAYNIKKIVLCNPISAIKDNVIKRNMLLCNY